MFLFVSKLRLLFLQLIFIYEVLFIQLLNVFEKLVHLKWRIISLLSMLAARDKFLRLCGDQLYGLGKLGKLGHAHLWEVDLRVIYVFLNYFVGHPFVHFFVFILKLYLLGLLLSKCLVRWRQDLGVIKGRILILKSILRFLIKDSLSKDIAQLLEKWFFVWFFKWCLLCLLKLRKMGLILILTLYLMRG